MELHHSPRVNRAAADAALHSARDVQEAPAPAPRRQLRATDHMLANAGKNATIDGDGALRLATAPRLARTPMAPRADGAGAPMQAAPAQRHQATASLRRMCLFGLVVAQTIVATDFMASVMPYQGRQPLEIAMLVLFAVLFAWISAGFWTAMAGFVLQAFGRDRHALSASSAPGGTLAGDARTAIVMPIYNESVARVFAGLRATYESVARSGNLGHFDFFVLSDSTDPDVCAAELKAWYELNRAIDGFGRVHYRRRVHRIKRKSGNIADFCRRWGRDYRYMVVLDADSIMTGDCLTRLVQLMESNTDAGIIQTAPVAAGRDTLHARVQQFSTRVYGPVFTAGLHFWQLGESHYFGHNAILRVAPFMQHCALARLPGTGSLSGEILSHDFVEAALMRRAGWGVWLAYDLPGSYEEVPPNLVDELTRDRRWCQGNLMNFRLFSLRGLHPAHRAVFLTGVMAYVSAPLWFLFLILSTALIALHTLTVPEYFVEPYQLFPIWPEWRPERAIALFSTTAVLLFLPKIAGVLLAWRRGARAYGGVLKLVTSAVAEIALSILLAPVRMLFHTQFVLSALFGWTIQWRPPSRSDSETTWREAMGRHGWHTLLGIAWAAGVYWLNPGYLWWLLPIVGALILSIPLSVATSRVGLGRRLRRARIFATPEESREPRVLRRAHELVRSVSTGNADFIDVVVDPELNLLVSATAPARSRQSAALAAPRKRLVQRALTEGPMALTAPQRLALLNDGSALEALHRAVMEGTAGAWHWHTARASARTPLNRRGRDAPAAGRSYVLDLERS